MSGITPLLTPEQQKPRIAVTTGRIPGRTELYSQDVYMEAVERAGGAPYRVDPYSQSAYEELQQMDGLVLTGGHDLDPSSYGAKKHEMTQDFSRVQDILDIEAANIARIKGLPVLAICRGMQALNVARGGTLHQHLPYLERVASGGIDHRHPTGIPATTSHMIEVFNMFDNPRAAEIGGLVLTQSVVKPGRRLELEVNSRHHQAIDLLGEDLIIIGQSADEIPEMIMGTGPGWELGTQFHLEEMPELAGIFGLLIGEAIIKSQAIEPGLRAA